MDGFRYFRFGGVLLACGLAVCVGGVSPGLAAPARGPSSPPAAKSQSVSLLSPLANSRNRQAGVVHLQRLRARLLEQLADSKRLDDVAVYVEDLNSGVWMGINERQQIQLGSLLKVGVAIAYLKWDQDHPGVLEGKISVLPEDTDTGNDRYSRKIDTPLPVGEYRVLQVIEKMIVSSDNVCLAALFRTIPKSWIDETFADIGIPNPFVRPKSAPVSIDHNKITSKQYAQMLKSLYNASYLDNPHSEMLLRFLIRTHFSEGIRRVLPGTIPMALKYGIWGSAIYECGIIYLDRNPYLVGIMTLGNTLNPESGLALIRDLAAVIHSFFVDLDR